MTKEEKIEIIIWPSNKIKEAYYEKNYYQSCGTLGNSCMRHKYMQKALNFYIVNKVKIVVILEQGKIAARALLWEDIKTNKGAKVTYLDRIYYCSDKYRAYYKKFVNDNGYYGYDFNNIFLYKDNINLTGITHLPYADTMRYLYIKDKVLTNNPDNYRKESKPKEYGNYISLTTTGDYGYRMELDKNSIREALSLFWCSKKDCIFIKKYNGYVREDNIINVNGEYYSKYDRDNIVNLGNGKYAHKNFIVKELYTGIKIYKLEATYIEVNKKEKGYIDNNNLITINDKYYSKYSPGIILCNIDNKYYFESSCYYYEGVYIPKHLTAIIYDLDKDGNISKEKYIHELQLPEHIELNNGIFIDKKYKSYIVKYNNKYYLRNQFRKNDDKQLLMFGLTPSKAPLECL